MDENTINMIKRRWKIMCIITFIFPTIIFVNMFLFPPKYETIIKILVQKENVNSQQYNNNTEILAYQRLLKTYVEIIDSKSFIQKAINEKELNITSDDIIKNLNVNLLYGTQIIEIKFENKDKELSKDVVDAISDEVMMLSKEFESDKFNIIEKSKLTDEYRALVFYRYIIVLSFLIGGIVSILFGFLLDFMDKKIKTKEQLEQILGLPVLGIIPIEN